MGNYSKSLEYLEKALAISKEVFKNLNHPTIATIYNNMGVNYLKIDKPKRALKYLFKAQEINKVVFGDTPQGDNKTNGNISIAYFQSGDIANAIKYSIKALSLTKKLFGEKHPETARIYNNLGFLLSEKGEIKKGLEYEIKALSIRKEVLGKNHPDIAQSYINLAGIYFDKGNYQKAYENAEKAFDIYILNRKTTFSALSNPQKKLYLKANENKVDGFFLYITAYLVDLQKNKKEEIAKELLSTIINNWLAYKGSILDSENRLLLLAKTSKDPEIKKKYQELVDKKRALGKSSQKYPRLESGMANWKKQLKRQEQSILNLEQDIAQLDPRFNSDNPASVTISDIVRGLNKDELYLDFGKTNSGYYLFTIDSNESIYFISYGEDSTAIDKQIKLFQKDIEAIVTKKSLASDLTDQSKQSLGRLYKLIFNNLLLKITANKKSLIISPDGALRLLPFEA